jgi:hypothetical protein
MNARPIAILVGLAAAAWLFISHPEFAAQAQQNRVEYKFLSGYAPALTPQLTEAAAQGWRAKSIGISQETVIVVLLERQRP